MRADEALLALQLARSLDMARALIMEGRVYEGEVRIDKPSQRVQDTARVSLREKARSYVSRGGYKLEKALRVFSIDLKGQICIDVGSSTGGFTDVMLRAGAEKVYAVDVGYGLLDWTLRQDARVCVMERTNARFLRPESFDPPPCFGATDVSFISLKAVLPPALHVLGPSGRFVALIKPQFEAPKEMVGPKGVVKERAVHESVIRNILDFVRSIGWSARDLSVSPIRGAEGNVEFLLDLVPEGAEAWGVPEEKIRSVLDETYDNFVNSPG